MFQYYNSVEHHRSNTNNTDSLLNQQNLNSLFGNLNTPQIQNNDNTNSSQNSTQYQPPSTPAINNANPIVNPQKYQPSLKPNIFQQSITSQNNNINTQDPLSNLKTNQTLNQQNDIFSQNLTNLLGPVSSNSPQQPNQNQTTPQSKYILKLSTKQ